jgi:hypothetical protein
MTGNTDELAEALAALEDDFSRLRDESLADGIIDETEQGDLDRIEADLSTVRGLLQDARGAKAETLIGELRATDTAPLPTSDIVERLAEIDATLNGALPEGIVPDLQAERERLQNAVADRHARAETVAMPEIPDITPDDPLVQLLTSVLPVADSVEDMAQLAEAMAAFAAGAVEGVAFEMPQDGPAPVTVENWAEVYAGYLSGLVIGVGSGIESLVQTVGFVAGVIAENTPAGIAWGILTEGFSDYTDRRFEEATQLIAIAEALSALCDDYEANPGGFGGDIGQAFGRIIAADADAFAHDTDFDKGRKVGEIAGAIVLEIVAEALLAYVSGGAGNIAKRASALLQAAKRASGRAGYADKLRRVIENAGPIKRFLRRLDQNKPKSLPDGDRGVPGGPDVEAPSGGAGDLGRRWESVDGDGGPDTYPDPVPDDFEAADTGVFVAPSPGTLRPGSPPGTVARLPSNNEAECVRLYHAARAQSPDREVGLFHNVETGTFILVQGDERSVRVPSKAALERAFGKDNPMFGGDAWQPKNWNAPIHTHPPKTASPILLKFDNMPSPVDLGNTKEIAEQTGQKWVNQIQLSDGKPVRVWYGYDPDTERFFINGPLPPRELGSGLPDIEHRALEFHLLDDYRRWLDVVRNRLEEVVPFPRP